MSAHTVSRSFLRCDGCGISQETLSEDALRARLLAATSGWKYTTRPNMNERTGKHRSRDTPLDFCPKCEIP